MNVRSESASMSAQVHQRQRAADWHGVQAMKAYRRRDYAAYVRHAKIADSIWSEVK